MLVQKVQNQSRIHPVALGARRVHALPIVIQRVRVDGIKARCSYLPSMNIRAPRLCSKATAMRWPGNWRARREKNCPTASGDGD